MTEERQRNYCRETNCYKKVRSVYRYVSLTDKTIVGIKWSFVDSVANQGFQFIIGIILARLLSPDEFGLIGSISIFLVISQTLADSGLSQALIRKVNCTQEDYSTAFYFNALIGIVFYTVLYVCAGSISEFFNEPQLLPLIRALGIVLVINCIGLIQRTILIKNINFRLQAQISIISNVIAGALGIWMAYTGWGVWSLVWKTLSQNFIMTFLLWVRNEWRPLAAFSLSSFREMFRFGSSLLATGLLEAAYRNIYYLVIGKFFSIGEVGYYARAEEFSNIPTANLYTIVNRVTYPALAILQNDNDRLKKGYRKLIKGTMFISLVCMIGMALVAEPLVVTLIGNKWLPSVPYLQLLCIIGTLWPLHAFNLDVVLIKGRSDLFLRIYLINRALIIPIVVIGIFFGIKIMLMAMFLHSCICYLINSYYSGKMIDYPLVEQLVDILPSFFVAVAMATGVFIMGLFASFSPLIELALRVIVGAVIVIGVSVTVRLEAFVIVKNAIRESFIKRDRLNCTTIN